MSSLDESPPSEASPWSVADAIWVVVAGVVGSVLASLAVGVDNMTVVELFGAVVPAQTLASVGAIALLARRRPPWREALGVEAIPRDGIGLVIGVALQFALSLMVALVVEFVFNGEAPAQDVVESAAGAITAPERLLVILGAVALAPAIEEVIFRGILLRALRASRGDTAAVYGSAAGFALVHLLDPGAVLVVPFLFILGVVLARQTISTGRLGRAFFTHVGFNAVTVVALFALAD